MNYIKHIEGVKRGSYADFKILYEEFSENLYGFVYRLTKSHTLSKEIVQETFIKIWVNRENLDSRMSFKSFLFKISKNKIIDEFRRQISSPVYEDYMEYSDNFDFSAEENVENKLDLDDFIRQLEKAKEKLTPRQREIFELSKEQGLSSSDIAEKLEISEQTIYNILSSAMKILRKEIKYSGFFFLIFFN